jgi:hypothetical protein
VEFEPVIQHWLVSVARAADLARAAELEAGSDVHLAGAWDLVGMTTRTSAAELAELVASH